MNWIDSSFAIEWLLATPRAQGHVLEGTLGTLPSQFAEICCFFLRRDPTGSLDHIALLAIHCPAPRELIEAARLYLQARRGHGKVSLSDAILASVVRSRGGALLSFDSDFRLLGMRQIRDGFWTSEESG